MKTEISKLKDKLSLTSPAIDEGMVETKATFNGLTFNEAITKLLDMQDVLNDLKNEISRVNAQNAPLINELETVKAKIGILTNLTYHAANVAPHRLEDNETGGKRKVMIKCAIDTQTIAQKLGEYKLRQLQVENELAVVNASVQLEFDTQKIESLLV